MSHSLFAATFWLFASTLAAASAAAMERPPGEVARFALVIGYNLSDRKDAPALRYADDDAVATFRLLKEAGVDAQRQEVDGQGRGRARVDRARHQVRAAHVRVGTDLEALRHGVHPGGEAVDEGEGSDEDHAGEGDGPCGPSRSAVHPRGEPEDRPSHASLAPE